MNLFGRKKEEEFDDEEELVAEEELRDRKLTRKFKDLNPENRRTRKEPIKPWGRRERIIVAAFFLITTLAATLMFLFSHEFKFPGLPKISFKSINIENPFGEKIIELGQKANSPKNDLRADAAITMFNEETKPLGGVYGFLVIRLSDGSRYGVSTDNRFQGASLLKLPLMVLMYKMSEEGSLNLDQKYVLKNSDKVAGSGDLINAKAGSEYSYRQLAELMGKKSDRTAYKVMKDVVSAEKLKNFVKETGMTGTDIDTGITTPNDFGIIFQKLWSGDLVNQEDKNEILGFLTDTIYESWITPGVPKNIKVAHKYGADSGVLADAGIVETKDPYVLVIMGQGITKQEADNLYPEISKSVYVIEAGDN